MSLLKRNPTKENEKAQMLYVILAAVIASIGGILFGYDIGITSGALLLLREQFQLSCIEQEIIVSSVLIGALFASFIGGNIVDGLGRKAGIVVSCVLFIAGALVLNFSFNLYMLIIGRLIVGVAVSLSVTAECTYISEISPANRRGMMVSLNEVGITVGFLLAYLVNYLFITTPNGWQYMFGMAIIPAALQAVGIVFMPASHHYLIVKGQTEKAIDVLKILRNTDDVDAEIQSVTAAVNEQRNRNYFDLFGSSNNMRNRMFLGMMLVFLQQFSGNANVLYYAPTVFQYFGFHSDVIATLVTVGLGFVKMLSTAMAVLIVDKLGRRVLLITGCLLMGTSILTLGIVGTITQVKTSSIGCSTSVSHAKTMESNGTGPVKTRSSPLSFATTDKGSRVTTYYPDLGDQWITEASSISSLLGQANDVAGQHNASIPDKEIRNVTNSSDYVEFDEKGTSLGMKIVSVISLMVFVCAYGISYGPVTWLVLSEIFPSSLRGRAISVATCVNWASNIIVSLTFLDIINAMGVGVTFVMYGVISYAAAIFIFFCVPETKNRTLEDITRKLDKGLIQKKLKLDMFSFNHQKYSLDRTNLTLESLSQDTS